MPKREDINKVLVIGSGPIVIGQACEFDYSGTQACKALKNLGYEIVLVNSNPATIMTDPETADVTYIEPLNVERLEQIIAKERPDALLPNLGGQSGLNLCSELAQAGILDKYNVKVIGVQVDAIERGEDRIEFKKSMDALGIDIQRVLDVVADCLNPVLRSAISIVCNAELTAPRGDGVGLGPQFLSLLRVVLQHFIALKVLGVGADWRCNEVNGRRGRVVEDLLGDGFAIDGHGNGLTTQIAFLILAEVVKPFRNGEGEGVATGLIVSLD